MKVLDAMLEKGKESVLGKLRIIELIEANLQLLMRIIVNKRNCFKIESNERISQENCRSIPRYSIEDAILEK